ncbi:hypothetical protein OC861_004944 [Tilletia horrida]|nr:hypothetical protein OC845_004846 [Tilletia horrida]KAK0563170.1 hypothetical protein OC861_004944 [Tilletia horrida]
MTSHRLNRLTLATPVPVAGPSTSIDQTSSNGGTIEDGAGTDKAELYDSIKSSRTVEDFTRFVSELRLNRQASRSTLPGSTQPPVTAAAGSGDDSASSIGDHDHLHPHSSSLSESASTSSLNHHDDQTHRQLYSSLDDEPQSRQRPSRCTCCCNKTDCERAIRAMSEWAALEEDLRLAAEIGQSLLHKHDAAVAALSKTQEEHVTQRDSLMSRLTQSIRESSNLQRQLAQSTLNLEAADASTRALLAELDQARSSTQALKRAQSKLHALEKHAEALTREAQDAKAEAAHERKKAETAEARVKKLVEKASALEDQLDFARREADLMAEKAASPQLGEDAIREARERLQLSLQAVSSTSWNNAQGATDGDGSQTLRDDADPTESGLELERLRAENEQLKEENQHLSNSLEAAREELAQARDGLVSSTSAAAAALPTQQTRRKLLSPDQPPSQGRKASGASTSTAFSDTYSFPPSTSRAAGGEADEDGGQEAYRGYVDDEEDEEEERRFTALSNELVTHADLAVPAATSASSTSVSRPIGTSNHMTMSPTMTSTSSISGSSLATPAITEDNSSATTVITTGGAVTNRPASIRSQSSSSKGGVGGSRHPALTHQRSGSVASSSLSRGAAGANGTTPSENATPGASSLSPNPTTSSGAGPAPSSSRDTRTAQLANLLEFVSRLYNRLVSVDIDSLHRRLQRQHLAGGDVGHLARTTVNSIIRDVEGLRNHFRKLTEAEQRAALKEGTLIGSGSGAAESLVSRREFFALLKMFQNLFAECARLRACVNEIHLAPNSATKILQEHLGLAPLPSTAADGGGLGVGALVAGGGGWLARMFTGPTSGSSGGGAMPPPPTTPGAFGVNAGPQLGTSSTGAPSPVTPTPGQHARNISTSVATPIMGGAAVLSPEDGGSNVDSPSAMSRPTVQPNESTRSQSTSGVPTRGTLSRSQSRNLSGLFAGAMPAPATGAGPMPITSSSTPGGAGVEPVINTGVSDPILSSSVTARDPSTLTPAQQRHSMFFRSGLASTTGSGPGGALGSRRPLSRIVDDDEISIHQGRRGYGGGAGTGGPSSRQPAMGNDDDGDDFQRFTKAAAAAAAAEQGEGPNASGVAAGGKTLRRRGLSDSSMHSTFLDQAAGAASAGGAPGGRQGAARTGGRGESAAGLLALSNANTNMRNSPMSRIITPATLSLKLSSNASGKTSAQFARKPVIATATATTPAVAIASITSSSSNWSSGSAGSGAGVGGGPSSPSISEDSGSFSTGGTNSTTTAAGSRDRRAAAAAAANSAGPRGLMPSLRSAPSAVALLFPGSATKSRTASETSTTGLSASNADASGFGVAGTSPGRAGSTSSK